MRVSDLPKLEYRVTECISHAWPSEALEKWKIGNIAKQSLDHADLLAEYFSKQSYRVPAIRRFAQPKLKDRLIEWREDTTAADRGTRIHHLIECLIIDADLPEDCDEDELAVACEAVAALEGKGFRPVYVEVRVFGTTDNEHWYKGTADIIARDDANNRWVLIDIKTGRRVSRTWLPQLGAYAHADFMQLDGEDEELTPTPRIEQAWVLHLPANKNEPYYWWLVDHWIGWRAFQACAQVVHTATDKKGIQGGWT